MLQQDTPDVRRIKWTQAWVPLYFYQHIYVPMLYCVVSIYSPSFFFLCCVFLSLDCLTSLRELALVEVALSFFQLGIKTRLQDFYIIYTLQNCKWLSLSLMWTLLSPRLSVCLLQPL